jgi:hypothetical protein
MMRRLVGGLFCVLLLGGATVSSAQGPAPCRWVTNSTTFQDGILFGVTAPEPNEVLAVGAKVSLGGRARTLIRHWDGAWETQPSPNANRQNNQLNGVAVAPNLTAWAVGEIRHTETRNSKTLVLRYKESEWRLRDSLNPSEDKNVLNGVDIAPSGDVYAAGERWNANQEYRTMIQRWDGKEWKVLRSSFPGILSDLDVIADDDIWAVGTKVVEGGSGRMFAVHFNGTKWTEVAVPSPAEGYSVLYDVSAAAPDDVWAVGEWYDRGDPRARIVHFDGTKWSKPAMTDLGTFVTLYGVSALDSDTAVAVGEDQHDDHDSRVVIEWDGTSWARADQDDETQSNWPQAVALAPDGSGWAVGYHSDEPSTEYIERRTCG